MTCGYLACPLNAFGLFMNAPTMKDITFVEVPANLWSNLAPSKLTLARWTASFCIFPLPPNMRTLKASKSPQQPEHRGGYVSNCGLLFDLYEELCDEPCEETEYCPLGLFADEERERPPVQAVRVPAEHERGGWRAQPPIRCWTRAEEQLAQEAPTRRAARDRRRRGATAARPPHQETTRAPRASCARARTHTSGTARTPPGRGTPAPRQPSRQADQA
jgi:hypothetical protein